MSDCRQLNHFLSKGLRYNLQVELMGQGVLDADMYPEVAKKIVEALWLATDHTAPQVLPLLAPLSHSSRALRKHPELLHCW